MPLDQIRIVTVAAQAGMLMEEVPRLKERNFILEPLPKGTASVVGLAATFLHAEQPDAIMAVLTADHFIANEEKFIEILNAARQVAERGELVTLGIQPDHPSTGYGYIHAGEQIGEFGGSTVFRARSFTEKPDPQTAQEYIGSGEYFWNSGMFVWRVERILEEIERWMPALHEGLVKVKSALGTEGLTKTIFEVWDKMTPETVDYGIMEKAERVVVIPVEDLGWVDIGSWDRLTQIHGEDPDGNLILSPESVALHTRNTLIFQDPDEEARRLIATLGVEDLVIVDTDEVILICHRDQAQDVKQIVNILSKRGLDRYL
jgi:mannose-1-phosphate guanylyltransferase